jgi:chemotaxis protein MotB
VKSFLSSLGWILFLALAAFFLLFYNLAYVARAERVTRQQSEVNMWIGQLQEARDSLKLVRAQWDTTLNVSLTFDELFGGALSLIVAPSAESVLRSYIPALQSSAGTVEVVGHTDNSQVPQTLKDKFPSSWDYAAAAAGAVARSLALWGISPGRIKVASLGAGSPVAGNATAEGRAQNRRVEILVRKQ